MFMIVNYQYQEGWQTVIPTTLKLLVHVIASPGISCILHGNAPAQKFDQAVLFISTLHN